MSGENKMSEEEYKLEVIGNIYDNPDLLEKGAEE